MLSLAATGALAGARALPRAVVPVGVLVPLVGAAVAPPGLLLLLVLLLLAAAPRRPPCLILLVGGVRPLRRVLLPGRDVIHHGLRRLAEGGAVPEGHGDGPRRLVPEGLDRRHHLGVRPRLGHEPVDIPHHVVFLADAQEDPGPSGGVGPVDRRQEALRRPLGRLFRDEGAVFQAERLGTGGFRRTVGGQRVKHPAGCPRPAAHDLAEGDRRVHFGHGVLEPHPRQHLLGAQELLHGKGAAFAVEQPALKRRHLLGPRRKGFRRPVRDVGWRRGAGGGLSRCWCTRRCRRWWVRRCCRRLGEDVPLPACFDEQVGHDGSGDRLLSSFRLVVRGKVQ